MIDLVVVSIDLLRLSSSLYDQVDTKFTFYNPNRTYSDVTRTWSMFVGNTTLLRTVNDTLHSKRLSTIDPESVHYEEILPLQSDETRSSSVGFHSDEISSSTSSSEEEEETTAEVDFLLEQIRTALDEWRLTDRSSTNLLEQLEELIDEFDRQTEKTLEIENVLQNFQFLQSIDDDDAGFQGERLPTDQLGSIFVDVLQRILLLLLHHRHSNDDDQLQNQIDQLKISLEWKRKGFSQVEQSETNAVTRRQQRCFSSRFEVLAESNRSIVEFWASNRTFFISAETCRNELTKTFNCSPSKSTIRVEERTNDPLADVAEALLDYLCLSAFRRKSFRVKSICFIQIYVLLMKSSLETKKIIEFIQEQRKTIDREEKKTNVVFFVLVDSFSQFSSLVSANNCLQIALLINRRTFNPQEIFGRLLHEFHWKLPDELLGLFQPAIRKDLIVHLRQCLDSHQDQPAKRLEIHKMIFNVQKFD